MVGARVGSGDIVGPRSCAGRGRCAAAAARNGRNQTNATRRRRGRACCAAGAPGCSEGRNARGAARALVTIARCADVVRTDASP